MLNIDEIQNGIVIDHIKAGTAVGLMELLGITGNPKKAHRSALPATPASRSSMPVTAATSTPPRP